MFVRPTNRPNIRICVRRLKHSMNSFQDLDFIVRGCSIDNPPPKTLIFFDDISESIEAMKYLNSITPPELQGKFTWFNSEMSNAFRDQTTEQFTAGAVCGLAATDSFGLVRMGQSGFVHY